MMDNFKFLLLVLILVAAAACTPTKLVSVPDGCQALLPAADRLAEDILRYKDQVHPEVIKSGTVLIKGVDVCQSL